MEDEAHVVLYFRVTAVFQPKLKIKKIHILVKSYFLCKLQSFVCLLLTIMEQQPELQASRNVQMLEY